ERQLECILGTYGSRRDAILLEETEDVKDLKPMSDCVLIKVEEAGKGLLVDYF
ncbi:hypothetical protein C5167_014795, partial [Papaver somniferum]